MRKWRHPNGCRCDIQGQCTIQDQMLQLRKRRTLCTRLLLAKEESAKKGTEAKVETT